MADTPSSANTILKILSGTQAGAEVSLAKGEYVLGSSTDDDIQVIDVSLKAGHVKLRVSPGKIEICAGSGSLKSANGITLEPNSDWQEIEPLDTVTAGTTRFALGPPTAQWASIAAAEAQQANGQAKPGWVPASAQRGGASAWLPRGRQLVVPLTALILLIGVAVWQLLPARVQQFGFGRSSDINEVETLRAAIAKLPFAQAVHIRQDVDSTIFVSGYVEAPVERRAVIGAVEKTGIPARVRVSVLQSIRSEIEHLIKSENVDVTATISRSGALVLDGVILNENAANRFVELVNDRIIGVSGIESRIKTAKSLLTEVEKLAQTAQINSWILLRNDGDLIEVSGAIPLEKIDAWVGFLQAFARRYAKDIALRSYVQLQNVTAAGPMALPDRAIIIGGQKAPGTLAAPASNVGNVVELDVERLKQGTYSSADVLIGAGAPSPSGDGAAAVTPALTLGSSGQDRPPVPGALTPSAIAALGRAPDAAIAGARVATTSGSRASPEVGNLGTPGSVGGPASAGNAGRGAAAPTATPPLGAAADLLNIGRSPSDELTHQARNVLEQWRDNKLSDTALARAIKLALDSLAGDEGGGGQQLAERYLALFATRQAVSDACWPDSHLASANVPAALLWLDVLSVSEAVSLNTFDAEMQALLLEAALNPRRVAKCAEKGSSGASPPPTLRSLYLAEVSRNPDFVRFITRDLRPFSLDITGANLAPKVRFVQIRSGQKLLEGGAPDRSSRIALVGELGVAIQLKDGLSSIVFGPDLTWLSE